jgi:hypothetical protein
VAQRLEARIGEQVRDVLPPAGIVVVDAEDLVAGRQEPLAQVRAEKSRAAGDQYPLGGKTHATSDHYREALAAAPPPIGSNSLKINKETDRQRGALA